MLADRGPDRDRQEAQQQGHRPTRPRAADGPCRLPHGVIAEMVNAQIEGAQASAKSVRWYAHEVRKKGAAVPERQRPAVEGVDSVTVVEPAGNE